MEHKTCESNLRHRNNREEEAVLERIESHAEAVDGSGRHSLRFQLLIADVDKLSQAKRSHVTDVVVVMLVTTSACNNLFEAVLAERLGVLLQTQHLHPTTSVVDAHQRRTGALAVSVHSHHGSVASLAHIPSRHCHIFRQVRVVDNQ